MEKGLRSHRKEYVTIVGEEVTSEENDSTCDLYKYIQGWYPTFLPTFYWVSVHSRSSCTQKKLHLLLRTERSMTNTLQKVMGSVEKAFTFCCMQASLVTSFNYSTISCTFPCLHFAKEGREPQDSAFIQFCMYTATTPASWAENLSIWSAYIESSLRTSHKSDRLLCMDQGNAKVCYLLGAVIAVF